MTPRLGWGGARLLTLLATVAVAAGCQDSIIKFLGPQNRETEFVGVDSLRFEAWDLDNVTDRRQWSWTNTGPQAVVHHRSFVHHGRGELTIVDAVGDTVYHRVPLEFELDNETSTGQAGTWTVTLDLFGARGRVDFSVVQGP